MPREEGAGRTQGALMTQMHCGWVFSAEPDGRRGLSGLWAVDRAWGEAGHWPDSPGRSAACPPALQGPARLRPSGCWGCRRGRDLRIPTGPGCPAPFSQCQQPSEGVGGAPPVSTALWEAQGLCQARVTCHLPLLYPSLHSATSLWASYPNSLSPGFVFSTCKVG